MMTRRLRLVALAVIALIVIGASAASAEYISSWGRQKYWERGDPIPLFGEHFISKKICSKKIKFRLKDADGDKFRLRSKSATSGYFSKNFGDVPGEAAFGRGSIRAKQKCGNPPLGIQASDTIKVIIGNPSAPPPEVTSATAPNVFAGDPVRLHYESIQTDYSISYLTVTVQVELLPDVWVDVAVLGNDSPVVKGGSKTVKWSTKSTDPPGRYRFLLEYFNRRSWDRTESTAPEETATAEFHLGRAFGNDLVDPTDGAIDNDGNLVVADTEDDQLEIFDPTGSKLEEVAGIYNDPKDVAFDDAGRTYVAEFGTQDVAFTEGTAITRIDNDNWSGGRCSPVGLDVVPDGSRIWVADSCSILAITRGGQEQLEVRDGIDDVDDVALAPDGSVWAADSGADVLLHLSSTGTLLGTISEPNIAVQTVDVDAAGRIWMGGEGVSVTDDPDQNGVVFVFDPDGTTVASFGLGLMDEATGIAVGGRAGNAYVIDRGEWQVVHLRHPL
jgi:sugar lactone lactonase YvrE